jgi:hypothetical protein
VLFCGEGRWWLKRSESSWFFSTTKSADLKIIRR